MIKVTFKEAVPVKKVGLEDGQVIILCCSNCNKPCVSLKVTKPNAQKDGKDIIWRARATCAYGCTKKNGTPDMSFPAKIKGLVHFAGCYKVDPNNPEDIIMTTSINDVQEENDSEGLITTYYTKAL